MDFKTTHNLPPALDELVNNGSDLSKMMPGEYTWAAFVLIANFDEDIYVRERYIYRGMTPNAQVKLKILKDFNGIVLDATALTLPEIKSQFIVLDTADMAVRNYRLEEFTRAHHVLFPFLDRSSMLVPSAIEAYNNEQEQAHIEFGQYHFETYNQCYLNAVHELNPAAQKCLSPPIIEVADSSQTP